MADFYLGEIILVPYAFAPINFLPCDGRLLPIDENTSLFNLIGTTFGGDGVTTIGLPDLRSRVPIHVGHGLGLSTYVMGQKSGTETIALTTPQMPSHTHALDTTQFFSGVRCQSSAGDSRTPVAHVMAREAAGVTLPYSSNAPDSDSGAVVLNGTASINPTPAAFAHNNVQPVLALMFCICVAGQFPVPQ